jgi:hypothetical protein
MKNYLTIFIIFFASCTKDKIPFVDCNQPTTDIEICKKLIVGKWKWSYEKYFDRVNQIFIIKTPASEGYSRDMEFKNSGNAYFYRNSTFEQQVKYSITTLDNVTGVPSDNTVTALIIFDLTTGNRIDFTPINICTDTLSLNYNSYSDTKGKQKWAKN